MTTSAPLKRFSSAVLVANVAREEFDVVGDLGEAADIAADHGVDDADIPAVLHQSPHQIGPDEASATGDHYTLRHQTTRPLLPTAKYESPISESEGD